MPKDNKNNQTKQQRKQQKPRGSDKKHVVRRTKTQKLVYLFQHLPQHETESSLSRELSFSNEDAKTLHPSILRIGLKFGEKKLVGGNARTISMLESFKSFISSYQTPPGISVARDLDKRLKPYIQALIDCRPHSVSMGNAIKFLRQHILEIPPDVEEVEAKELLCEKIDSFIFTSILAAQEVIVQRVTDLVHDGDIILTYSHSFVAFLEAKNKGKRFKVVVIASNPIIEESFNMYKSLKNGGVSCEYVDFSALSLVVSKITKVILGASGLMSNGSVLSRVGTAPICLMAISRNKPVVFCAESYKFSSKVQLDGIANNELHDPDQLLKPSTIGEDGLKKRDALSDWRDRKEVFLLNLMYDLTPVKFLDSVVTEVGIIPATSVPVVVREMNEGSR
eukprot:maker-scaffold_7-snap-gene-16.5-mRNA-1 protein AED:0.04 eAED:0.04 QI:162/0.83/0.85/1/0.83/0.71/7/55/392